jgi:polysaccharide biosynthesis transport protein
MKKFSTPMYPEQNVVQSEEISLAELLNKIVSAKWYVLLGYTLVLSLVALYTNRQAPVYEASSLILINNESSSPPLADLIGMQMGGNRNVSNEIEIIKSRTIALRVADALMDWQTVPGSSQTLSVLSSSENSSPLSKLDVAQRLQSQFMSVRPVNPDVDLIEIKVVSTIPREAALIADMFADEFYSYNQARSRRRASAGREFLEEQAQRFDTLLVSAES